MTSNDRQKEANELDKRVIEQQRKINDAIKDVTLDSNKYCEEHAQLFLKGLFIVSSGALIVIPPYISIFDTKNINIDTINKSITAFAVVILLVLIIHALTYLYYRVMGDIYQNTGEKEKKSITSYILSKAIHETYDTSQLNDEISALDTKISALGKWLSGTLIAIILLASTSLILTTTYTAKIIKAFSHAQLKDASIDKHEVEIILPKNKQ